MKRADLEALLLSAGWFADPASVAQCIFRADPTLPALVGLLKLQTPEQCAAIVINIITRRGRYSKKKFAVTLYGTDVYLERTDYADQRMCVMICSRFTSASLLAAALHMACAPIAQYMQPPTVRA